MSFAEQLYNANTYIEIYMQVTQNQACLTHDKTKTLTWGLDTDLIEKSHHHNTPDILLVLFREVKISQLQHLEDNIHLFGHCT